MISYHILGRHGHRTPLAYQPYLKSSNNLFKISANAESASVILFGFIIDVKENEEEVLRIKKINPFVKFVVISEEPLWDTVWSGDYINTSRKLVLKDEVVEVFYFNYFNSSIFGFKKIPYYITTEYKFIARYRTFFQRNIGVSSGELNRHFRRLSGEAYFIEKREDSRYDFVHAHAVGLSVFRSNLAKLRKDKNSQAVIVGKGWHNDHARQKLVDWHLDKISLIDRNFKFCSAIENTDAKNYISEKYFDALATLSVPIVSAGSNVEFLFNSSTAPCLNLPFDNIELASNMIDDFAPTAEFLESYRDNVQYWLQLFSDLELYRNEIEERIKVMYNHIVSVL